jgi:phosphotransferase system HPr-like phosphotransfer protein
MVSQDILIINRLGLHARAAAQLVRMANDILVKSLSIKQDRSPTQNPSCRS